MEDIISRLFSVPFKEACQIWQKEKAKLMTGKITSKQFLEEVKSELREQAAIDELLEKWLAYYQKEAEGVDWKLLDYISKLKRRYKVYLFTDILDFHDRFNRRRGIYEYFHRVFKSYKEGFIKSQDEAFLNVLKKIKARPEECAFIDDLETNIAKAESLGIKGIVYKNLSQLKESLQKLGIN